LLLEWSRFAPANVSPWGEPGGSELRILRIERRAMLAQSALRF
jgi:hypothetical protein